MRIVSSEVRFEQPRLQHLNIGASLARLPRQLLLRTEPHGIFLGKVDARVWICSKSKDRSPTELVYGMLRGRLDIEHQVDESVHTTRVLYRAAYTQCTLRNQCSSRVHSVHHLARVSCTSQKYKRYNASEYRPAFSGALRTQTVSAPFHETALRRRTFKRACQIQTKDHIVTYRNCDINFNFYLFIIYLT